MDVSKCKSVAEMGRTELIQLEHIHDCCQVCVQFNFKMKLNRNEDGKKTGCRVISKIFLSHIIL